MAAPSFLTQTPPRVSVSAPTVYLGLLMVLGCSQVEGAADDGGSVPFVQNEPTTRPDGALGGDSDSGSDLFVGGRSRMTCEGAAAVSPAVDVEVQEPALHSDGLSLIAHLRGAKPATMVRTTRATSRDGFGEWKDVEQPGGAGAQDFTGFSDPTFFRYQGREHMIMAIQNPGGRRLGLCTGWPTPDCTLLVLRHAGSGEPVVDGDFDGPSVATPLRQPPLMVFNSGATHSSTRVWVAQPVDDQLIEWSAHEVLGLSDGIQYIGDPCLSPDGAMLSFSLSEAGGTGSDLWVAYRQGEGFSYAEQHVLDGVNASEAADLECAFGLRLAQDRFEYFHRSDRADDRFYAHQSVCQRR